MIKDILNSNEETTPNSKEIAILKEHFPSCFKNDGSFDIESFKGFLSDKVSITDEGYELKFLGKNYARLLASVDTTTVITPNEEHNSKPENKNSENIYISGDNLDGLKHLLKSYSGQVKCIYIDPPYNTGTDGFVYNDNFDFTVDSLSEKLSISEEQAERILDLTKRGSASHSAWLMFMYPRLLLARDLLTEDGVIFISIDDNECHNLKLICDDVFGEENFIASYVKQSKVGGGSDSKFIVKEHEYCLVYGKNISMTSEMFISHDEDYLKRYKEEDENGRYFWDTFARPGLQLKAEESLNYEIECPDGSIIKTRWIRSKDRFKKEYEEGKIRIIQKQDGEWSVQFKQYLNADGKKPRSMTMDFGGTIEGKNDLSLLFDNEKLFNYPKSVKFIKTLIETIKDDNAIILDFFSGSATTAHAVMNLNAEDGGNRKFIMVQLPEIIEEGKPAYEAGYRTIDQIGMDRIIKAANKIKEENPDLEADLGFKHLILQEPTPNTLDKIEEFDPDENKLFADKTLLDEFGKPTILSTWLVRDGYGLTAQPEELDLSGYKGYFIDKHLYLIDTEIPNEAIEKIVVKYETDGSFNPENIVLFGYSFTWTQMEQLKINLKRLKDTEKNLNINFDVRY